MARTFGVEEELLLVDARTRLPLAAGDDAVHLAGLAASLPPHMPPRPALTVELQREQIEIVGPPCATLAQQVSAIREGRLMADAAARAVGGRAVPLATSVSAGLPHLVPEARYERIQRHVGLLAAEQLTCGLHVHVEVDDHEEGVAILDRIRVWLPVLLALSANSPFWYGVETGFASYRYQAWTRWPTAGAYELFGSVAEHDRRMDAVLRSGVALDPGMLYHDARLSARYPTVEVRVADVCLDPAHAAVVATLVRALVETAARQAREGVPPAQVGVTELRAWSWQASRFGVEEQLISPATGAPAPAADVVGALLDLLRPVLAEYEEVAPVEVVVAEILHGGSGARRQRAAFAGRGDLIDVVDAAIALGIPVPPVDGDDEPG
ncbi:glutamate--cysteine ligase [Antribacter gilvus]|uniref:glutamate--cysteine ligase n=1 Tax=Antribacter gilvus TaxID=2304675 RepID=UPI000F792E53|nr:glutamate--cysteine ligase [Antribacter gilvus]